jgi:hypothetical protein
VIGLVFIIIKLMQNVIKKKSSSRSYCPDNAKECGQNAGSSVGVVRGKNSNRWTLSTCLVRLSPVVLSAHSWRLTLPLTMMQSPFLATIHNNFSRLAPYSQHLLHY